MEKEKSKVLTKLKFNVSRISSPIMTIYERCAIIGYRAEQLVRGSKPLVSFDPTKEKFNAYEIAKRELEEKVSPVKIIRKLPNNVIEEWDIIELRQIK